MKKQMIQLYHKLLCMNTASVVQQLNYFCFHPVPFRSRKLTALKPVDVPQPYTNTIQTG
jgi:hypothetical protein